MNEMNVRWKGDRKGLAIDHREGRQNVGQVVRLVYITTYKKRLCKIHPKLEHENFCHTLRTILNEIQKKNRTTTNRTNIRVSTIYMSRSWYQLS